MAGSGDHLSSEAARGPPSAATAPTKARLGSLLGAVSGDGLHRSAPGEPMEPALPPAADGAPSACPSLRGFAALAHRAVRRDGGDAHPPSLDPADHAGPSGLHRRPARHTFCFEDATSDRCGSRARSLSPIRFRPLSFRCQRASGRKRERSAATAVSIASMTARTRGELARSLWTDIQKLSSMRVRPGRIGIKSA